MASVPCPTVQVADFLGDAAGLQHGTRILAEQLLAASSGSNVDEELLDRLLELSGELLSAVIQACVKQKPMQHLLGKMPFLLHAALVQQRTEPVSGGIALAFNLPPLDVYADPPRHKATHELEGHAFAAFCAQLMSLRSLVAADLSGVLVDTQMLAAFIQVLGIHSQLTSLQLGFKGAVSVTAGRLLGEALPRWPHLQRLEVSAHIARALTPLPEPHPQLSHGLRALTALTHLALIRVPASEDLNAALAAMTTLHSLNISSSTETPRRRDTEIRGQPLCITSLSRMPHLTALALAGRTWDLSERELCSSLRKLDLRGSDLLSDRCDLRLLTRLEDLSLAGLSARSTAAAHDLIRGISRMFQLTRLVLGDTDGLTSTRSLDDAAPELSDALTHLTRLRELRVCELQRCSRLTAALAPAWQHLPQLTTLHFHITAGESLYGAGHDAEAADVVAPASTNAVACAAPLLPSLQHVHLTLWVHVEADEDGDLDIDFDEVWLSVQLLPRHPNLQSLGISLRSAAADQYNRHNWPWGPELLTKIATLSQLQELRLCGELSDDNDGGDVADTVSRPPELVPSLTNLQLQHCNIRAKFVSDLRKGQLVHLALQSCACPDGPAARLFVDFADSPDLPDSLRVVEFTHVRDEISAPYIKHFLERVSRSAVTYVNVEGVQLTSRSHSGASLEELCHAFNDRHVGEKLCRFRCSA